MASELRRWRYSKPRVNWRGGVFWGSKGQVLGVDDEKMLRRSFCLAFDKNEVRVITNMGQHTDSRTVAPRTVEPRTVEFSLT